jgi:peptidoglycan hydrolase-like protein with peptidoglycan-binding domain
VFKNCFRKILFLAIVVSICVNSTITCFSAGWPVLRKGSIGAEVESMQILLNYLGFEAGSTDGVAGARTDLAIRNFQQSQGIVIDGVAGQNTLYRLVITVRNGERNEAVRAVQHLLRYKFDMNLNVDGVFGDRTLTSVRSFQSAMGLKDDGVVGSITWRHLLGVPARQMSDQSATASPESNVRTFSLVRDGNTYVSSSFQVREFRSRDGADTVLICPELVANLQRIRDHFGRPVNITSAYRTESHNQRQGGASSSRHVTGQAADFWISGISVNEIYDYAIRIGIPGVIRYPDRGFVHIDTRAGAPFHSTTRG